MLVKVPEFNPELEGRALVQVFFCAGLFQKIYLLKAQGVPNDDWVAVCGEVLLSPCQFVKRVILHAMKRWYCKENMKICTKKM